MPFDVSEATLRAERRGASPREYPGIEVHAVVGDFERHLGDAARRAAGAWWPSSAARSATSSRGSAARFLARSRGALEPGDALLLGTDLVKDVGRLEAAYDDAAGVTAEFNRNVLRVLNRELGADFRPERFAHVARWDPEHEWIEMRLRSDGRPGACAIAALGLEVEFADGEELRTEISAKFRRPGLERELAAAGFDIAAWWTDAAGDFALIVARVNPARSARHDDLRGSLRS